MCTASNSEIEDHMENIFKYRMFISLVMISFLACNTHSFFLENRGLIENIECLLHKSTAVYIKHYVRHSINLRCLWEVCSCYLKWPKKKK